MERLAQYKLNYESKWLTAGGVLFGFAFFLQALDFLGLRSLQGVSFWQLLLFMIWPMAMEATWCACTRVVRKEMTPVFGIFGAVFCLNLCLQAIFYNGTFLTAISILIYLLCGAAMVLISWGFVPHRMLGILVFGVATVIRLLSLDLVQWLRAKNWAALVYEVPSVCILGGLMLFFMAIHAENDGAEVRDPGPQPEVDEPTVKIDLEAEADTTISEAGENAFLEIPE